MYLCKYGGKYLRQDPRTLCSVIWEIHFISFEIFVRYTWEYRTWEYRMTLSSVILGFHFVSLEIFIYRYV